MADCYRNSLQLADENSLRSIAFPNISCGVYGFPLEAACRIALTTAAACLPQTDIETVTFVCFQEGTRQRMQMIADGLL